MIDIVEILVHWYAGRSQHELAASLRVDRKTIRKYVAPAVAAGIVPGGPERSRAQWAELVKDWFPELVDTRLRQVTWPDIELHRDYVADQLKAGVTAATIHQRLRDEHALTASVSSFRRWAAANLPEEVRRDQVRVLGETPPPGHEAQVDYGKLGMWTDPATGRRMTVWAFVMVLSCSRHLFVRPVIRVDQQAWSEAHVEAFAFFGGVPQRIVPDNLATGVERADLYDPKINRAYAELAEHYGVLVDPARVRKPRDKARVERPMPYVRDSFWRGREFASLAQMQTAAVVWCREVAGQRHHRSLDGAAPAAVFTSIEAQALKPLPVNAFVLATWSTATVGPDVHVKVGKSLYSVPWRLIGQRLDARRTWNTVQLFHNGLLVATHATSDGGRKRTDMSHYPPEKIAFAMKTPTWCRRRSAEIGTACAAVIGAMLEVGVLYRLRAAQGVLSLAEKHGPQRLESACGKAMVVGDPSYRTIKGILTAGLEADPPLAATGDGGAPAHLHGPAALFSNVYALPTPAAAPDPDTGPSVKPDHGDEVA